MLFAHVFVSFREVQLPNESGLMQVAHDLLLGIEVVCACEVVAGKYVLHLIWHPKAG